MDFEDLYAYTRVNCALPAALRPLLTLRLNNLQLRIDCCNSQIAQIDAELSSIAGSLSNRHSVLLGIRSFHMGDIIRLCLEKASLEVCKAPIRRVPPEIIAEVMFFATGDEYGWIGSQDRQTFRNLRAVSKFWRETAFSTPALWRDFRIEGLDVIPLISTEAMSQRLISWLQRCGRPSWMALSIVVCDTKYHLSSILYTLATHGSIVTGLYLESCDTVISLELVPQPSRPLSSLETLSIGLLTDVYGNWEGRITVLELTETCPKLYNLILSSNPHMTHIGFTVSHRHLQVLELDYLEFYVHTLCEVLANLPSLKLLWALWVIVLPVQPFASFMPPITHRSLEKLSFAGAIPIDLFSALTCPALMHLHIGAAWKDELRVTSEQEAATAIADFLRRSNPASVDLATRRGIPSSLVRLLLSEAQTIPCLHEFQVAYFHQLVGDDGSPTLLPNSVHTLFVEEDPSDLEFAEWLTKLGLDGRDCSMEVRRGEFREYWVHFAQLSTW
ncbi:hypothetical protein BKA70DRAFT_1279124 [Coprinopsis sp. MPI-PUGE-AT-0042]|nr:hypothetical protein BKA70DRAFT_1279124 [Coprinopsis sp. MPI-PUGE-AT-0042]